MPSILVVCTGNVCRSPIAEGFLRAALDRRFGADAPDVVSAGTMGWQGSGADLSSIEAAGERGIDISDHRARRWSPGEIEAADLLLGMAGEHADAAEAVVPGSRSKAFTLKELVRLLEALPPVAAGDAASSLASRVEEADGLRNRGFSGDPFDDDVMDPLGMPLASFRAVARELDEWCGRLVEGLFGAEVPAVSGVEGE